MNKATGMSGKIGTKWCKDCLNPSVRVVSSDFGQTPRSASPHSTTHRRHHRSSADRSTLPHAHVLTTQRVARSTDLEAVLLS